MVNTLNPGIFAPGGGMSNVEELYDELPAALAGFTYSPVFRTLIVKARHGDASGARGAARLWPGDDRRPPAPAR